MSSTLPKQYMELLGKPILSHTMDRLSESHCIDGIVVGMQNDDEHWESINFDHEKVIGISDGGTERVHTVLNAIHFLLDNEVADTEDWALVHDAVRPCVDIDDIALLASTARSNGEGALLATRVTDTLKRANENGRVDATVQRESHWRALTPQMFPMGKLKAALEASLEKGLTTTDESAAMELYGIYPELVEGSSTNIKITMQSDLLLAEFFLKNLEKPHDTNR